MDDGWGGYNGEQYTHIAAVALTPLTTHPQTQAELVRSPVRGQEQEQPGVVPSCMITI